MGGEERGKGEDRGQRVGQRPRPLQAQPLTVRLAVGRRQGQGAAGSAPGKRRGPDRGPAPAGVQEAAGEGRRRDGASRRGGGDGGGPNRHHDIRQSLWVRRPDLFFGQPNQGSARTAFGEPPAPAREEVGAASGPGTEGPEGGAAGALVQEVGGSPVVLEPAGSEKVGSDRAGSEGEGPAAEVRPRLRLTTPLAPLAPRDLRGTGGGRRARPAGAPAQEGGTGGRKGSS